MTGRLHSGVVAVGLSIAGIAVGAVLLVKGAIDLVSADIAHGVALPAVKR